MPSTRIERVLVKTGPLLCPECVSEDAAKRGAHAGAELECGNCGERFERDSALLCLGELNTEPSADFLALDCLAEFLYADPEQFPSGADTCEALDRVLTQTGRGPAATHHAERPHDAAPSSQKSREETRDGR